MEIVPTTISNRTAYERLVWLLRRGNITVLSGAGLSTESGIPDYRGPDGKRRVMPMTYDEFVASPANRQRYWARSFVGWRRFAGAGPNDGHRAVADLQRLGLVRSGRLNPIRISRSMMRFRLSEVLAMRQHANTSTP